MRKLYLIIACVLRFFDCAYGQKTFSLEECFQLALKNNTTIKQASNQVDLSLIDLSAAKSGRLPSLAADLGHYIYFGKNIDPVSNVYIRDQFSGGYLAMGLRLNVFSGFNNLLNIKQNKCFLQSSEAAKKNTELKIMSDVTLAYGRWVFNKEQSLMIRSRINTLYKEMDIVSELIKSGRMKEYEYYTLNARLNIEQVNLTTTQNDSITAVQDLKLLLNIPYKEKFDVSTIDTSLLFQISSMNFSPDELLEKVMVHHPLIKQAQANVQSARLSVKIAQSGYYPSISLGANLVSNYNINERNLYGEKIPIPKQLNNNYGENMDISIHIPIFSQRTYANRVKKEKLNLSNAELANNEVVNEVSANILSIVNGFNAAKQSYKSSLASWQQSTFSYKMYEERYRLGLSGSLELITAKDMQTAADAQFLQSKLNLFFQYELIKLLIQLDQ